MQSPTTEESTKTPLIESHYLPSIPYMALFLQYKKVYIDLQENYQKQSYRNRAYVKVSNNILGLTVPINKEKQHQNIKEIKIDYSQSWLRQHWRTLQSAYGKAPFYEYYIDYFEKVFFKKPKFLIDLNNNLLTTCLNLLNNEVNFVFLEENLHIDKESCFFDLKGIIHPKKGYAPERQNDTKIYTQVFGKGFVKNLSIIDLLFCEGPQARTILKQNIFVK